MRYHRPILLLAALVTHAGWAQPPASVATPSRDAASAYVARGNFIVSRIGRECLALVGRPESPQELVNAWRQRNARYVTAASQYMEKRLEEAAAGGGAGKREAVLDEIRAAVQGSGDDAVRSLLQGRKEEGCMSAITLIDTGVLDISSKEPLYDDIAALVRWAER
jgi:hypothetical protein